MTKCGKAVKPAKNGASRGVCARPVGHGGLHSNKTCPLCGIALTPENTHSHIKNRWWCKKCCLEYHHHRYGHKPQNVQTPGGFHTFPCGCSGILPHRGESNYFARCNTRTNSWYCRVLGILGSSASNAQECGYTSIDPKTSHSVIRELMKAELCWRCRLPLKWTLGRGQTPHLHHNHDTGEIYGFTHPHCNPQALEHEIDELRQRIAELEMPHAKAA
jgi:hypothetical protein